MHNFQKKKPTINYKHFFFYSILNLKMIIHNHNLLSYLVNHLESRLSITCLQKNILKTI